jgi:pimeloyl-ACP methyl ester carboxylesterase
MRVAEVAPRIEIVSVADYRIAVHCWEYPTGDKDLLLLHGAGVASELTWYPLVASFQCYRRVFAVDLRGMGRSHAPDWVDRPLQLAQLADDLDSVAFEFAIETVDLVGYSFGGLVSLLWNARHPNRVRRMALIEPALLERESLTELRQVRAGYADAVAALLDGSDPTEGVRKFLDLIAPARSRHPRVERMTIQRLASRPLGLAYALQAVNEAAWHLDRMALLDQMPPTLSVIGGKSPEAAHALHRRLADTREEWGYEVIAGVDHALPYQKPDALARCLLQHLASA